MNKELIDFYFQRLQEYAKYFEIDEKELLEFVSIHYPKDMKAEMDDIFSELRKRLGL